MTSRSRMKAQAEWELQQARRRRLTIAAWIAVGLVFVGVLGYLIWQQARPAPKPGEAVPVLPSGHIAEGMPHDPYNSDPPTSGPHYGSAVEAGFYDQAPADEYLVHNLQHGHVIIWYNCSQLSDADCTALKDKIRAVMGRADVSAITGTLKLVAVPRPSLETEVALTSWGRLDRLDRFDEREILAFIRAWRDHAPENGAA